MPGMKRWIFVPNVDPALSNTFKTDVQYGHGTCVLSKAAGVHFGVAKNADVVIVKLPAMAVVPRISYHLDAINRVAEDLVKNQVKKAVLNLSFGT